MKTNTKTVTYDMSITSTWTCLFPDQPLDTVAHDGETYYITSSTGEGVFAYEESTFTDGLDAAEEADSEPYTAFCDATEPVESRAVARAVYAATGLQICRGGTCTRVIDFEEE